MGNDNRGTRMLSTTQSPAAVASCSHQAHIFGGRGVQYFSVDLATVQSPSSQPISEPDFLVLQVIL